MDKRRNIMCLYLLYLRKKKKRQSRIHWVHPLNLQRDTHGAFVILFEDLKADEEKFSIILECLHQPLMSSCYDFTTNFSKKYSFQGFYFTCSKISSYHQVSNDKILYIIISF